MEMIVVVSHMRKIFQIKSQSIYLRRK